MWTGLLALAWVVSSARDAEEEADTSLAADLRKSGPVLALLREMKELAALLRAHISQTLAQKRTVDLATNVSGAL